MNEKEKLKIAINTTYMDRRPAKGTAILIRNTIKELLKYRDEFDITLIHREKIPEDPTYREFKEIVLPKIKLPRGSSFVSEFIFHIFSWFKKEWQFDIIYYPYPLLHPFFWISSSKKIIFMAMDGGAEIAGFTMKGYGKPTLVPKFFSWRIAIFLAISNFGKHGIEKKFNVSSKKVISIYCGLGEEFNPVVDKVGNQEYLSSKYNIPFPYILDISRFDPHKNILRLIEAYNELVKKDSIKENLVFVGGRHLPDYSAQVDELIDRLNIRDRIFVAPFISEEDMPKVYSGAEMLVFPSLYEGFGLPAIEAMGCGIPTVLSDLDVLKEVSDGSAEFVDPYNVKSIENGIRNILQNKDIRKKLSRKGIIWAKHFTWKSHVESLVLVFRSV